MAIVRVAMLKDSLLDRAKALVFEFGRGVRVVPTPAMQGFDGVFSIRVSACL